jgi:NADPH:quinone reductase-like Zn-dependent oxidoreductase
MQTTDTNAKQWRVVNTDSRFDGLHLEDAPVPKLGERDVLVRIHAASLNFRDLMIARVSNLFFQAPILLGTLMSDDH